MSYNSDPKYFINYFQTLNKLQKTSKKQYNKY